MRSNRHNYTRKFSAKSVPARFGLFQCLLLALTCCWTLGCEDSNRIADTKASESIRYQGEYPINVVATVGMVADIAENVGGDHITIQQLCGAGVDPHLYKPTRDDIVKIVNADIVFYSGLALEGKLADTLSKTAREKRVVPVTDNLSQVVLLRPEGNQQHAGSEVWDPHVWMDVSAWSRCVQKVADDLSTFDPKHKQEYLTNAAAYQQKLQKLHQYGLDSIATIPAGKRILITSHDAFNYFGRTYGLDVQGVQGLSTESESGLQRINQLVDLLVEKNVEAVFVESSVPRKNIQALVEGVNSKGRQIRIGGELYSDAMGSGGTYEGTYIGMLDHNITLVTNALGGSAPEKGMQGKLQGPHDAGN